MNIGAKVFNSSLAMELQINFALLHVLSCKPIVRPAILHLCESAIEILFRILCVNSNCEIKLNPTAH